MYCCNACKQRAQRAEASQPTTSVTVIVSAAANCILIKNGDNPPTIVEVTRKVALGWVKRLGKGGTSQTDSAFSVPSDVVAKIVGSGEVL